MSPLRVLVVIPGPEEGSSMIFAKRQAAAVARAGVTIEWFFLASRTRPMVLWWEWRRLRARVRTFQPDVVHATFGTMTAFMTVLATRRPVVVSYYGGDLNRGTTRPWIRFAAGRVMSQLASLRARGIICVSQELRDRLWWRGASAVIIPTGVDTTVFRPLDRGAARRELGWDERPAVLFNAGRDPEVKRLDLAQAAVVEVRREVPDVRFEVLRGGVSPGAMPLYMNAADCLLITSDSEGSPTVVPEAMACGLPIVSVPVGDVPERLTGVTECVIVARAPADLAEAMVSLLRRPRRSNGPEVVSRTSTDTLAAQVIAVYRRARAGGGNAR